jgi:hypothetical protein
MGSIDNEALYISKDTLNNIYVNEETFILRTLEMLKALWPNEYYFWSLMGPDDNNTDFKKIPKEIKKSIQGNICFHSLPNLNIIQRNSSLIH